MGAYLVICTDGTKLDNRGRGYASANNDPRRTTKKALARGMEALYCAFAFGDKKTPLLEIWRTRAATRREAEALALQQGWDRDSFIIGELED